MRFLSRVRAAQPCRAMRRCCRRRREQIRLKAGEQLVPWGAVPGVTEVLLDQLSGTLPADAAPGRRLRVELREGHLRLTAVRKRVGRAVVCGDAIPGVSSARTRGELVVDVKVPFHAAVGDTLLVSQEGVRVELRRRQGSWLAAPSVAAEEDLRRHEQFQEVFQRHKGTWNPKVERASTDRLQVPGIVAKQGIARGEVLVRCPPELLISPAAVRQLLPDYAIMVAEAALELPEDVGSPDLALQATFLASLIAGEELTCSEPARSVWSAFLHVLCCETFERHPYRLALQDPSGFKSSLAPSCEADLIEYLSWGVSQWYEAMSRGSPVTFSGEQFLRAWLMVTTRAFQVEGSKSTLVPGLDSFNHDPERVAARAAPDGFGGMLVAATREIAAGEEVFLVYQSYSNSELYRTYGFTLPCEVMKHQTFTLLPSRARFLLLKHLPSLSIIEFNSGRLMPSLVSALQACATSGRDPVALLRELLASFAGLYEKSAGMEVGCGRELLEPAGDDARRGAFG